LIVEDDAAISSMLRRGLTFEGYDVTHVTSGTDALTFLRTNTPDLIVLDIMLPGMNGFEVCRRIRNAGETMPILMLTARAEVMDRVTGLDAGADDYLVKPFAFEELLARTRALLRRHQGSTHEDTVLTFHDLRLDTGTRFAYRGD